jgi:DNA polymerase-3 subunit alpha
MGENGSGFVHLHVHTEYSFQEATCRLDELIQKVKSFGMTTLAITDKSAIHGAVRFYELAKHYGIHPILGCEIKVNEAGESLIVLAATNKGYGQIIEWLNTGSYPHDSSGGDLIVLSGGRNGTIHRLLASGNTDLAEERALEYSRRFGKDNFFLEVQDHGFADDRDVIQRTLDISRKKGIPLVATHDVHYLTPEDEPVLHMLQNSRDHQSSTAGALYLPSPLEMEEKFRYLPEALANTVKIAHRCQIQFENEGYSLPKFPVPEDCAEETYLQQLCMQGLQRRFDFRSVTQSEQQRIIDRMNRELAVIHSRGLASYFLVVWDIVHFARKNGIPFGPGRGSAAGSLVVYLLGITDVNPIVYDLSFERFLSPDRPDLPDIDLDVCQVRRPEILKYMKEKYGPDRVAHIGVINTFGTRGAVRTAGKYVNLPDQHVNLLAKLLPAFSGKGGIRHCLQTLPELKKLPVDKEPYRSLFRHAENIEGLPRNLSAHPSGILIGEKALASTVPLQQRPNGEWMTSYTKEDLKPLGLLKIDLLGLRNLSVMAHTFQSIWELTGRKIDQKEIPLGDMETFRTISHGDTLGCFQLESMGIRNLMRKMQPKTLEDLSSLLALYRPGAWEEGMVETYLRRRQGKEKIDYVLPDLEPILGGTYGLILYQEQVMQIAHVVAGYSMGEADSLRRALSKKRLDSLEYHQKRFVQGAVERGRRQEEASAVFEFLARFAGFSFNKAHSVSYAYLSYWTVYLKTHFPKPYMAALLSSEGGYYDKRVYLREAVKMGIPLLAPDANRSGFGFQAESDGIRVGLDAIKGAGPEAVTSLLRSRQNEGQFSSWQDFLWRMQAYRIKRPVLQAWIAAGACDSLGDNRREMIAALESPSTLFADEPREDFSEVEKRRLEKSLLGFSLDLTPSGKWWDFLKRYNIVLIEKLVHLPQYTRLRICGTIIHSRRQPTGNGTYLLVLVVQDHSEMVEVILYPRTYKACLYELNPEGILVEGTLRIEDGLTHIVAEKIKALGG